MTRPVIRCSVFMAIGAMWPLDPWFAACAMADLGEACACYQGGPGRWL